MARYIGIIVVCLFLCSCVQRKVLDREVSQSAIKEAINAQVQYYQEEDRENFFSYISQDYYPNYKELNFTIDDFLYANDNIQLDLRIEKILVSGETGSVDINWDKTYVNKQGTLTQQSGSSVLIFDISGGKPILKNIKGDNLFTQ